MVGNNLVSDPCTVLAHKSHPVHTNGSLCLEWCGNWQCEKCASIGMQKETLEVVLLFEEMGTQQQQPFSVCGVLTSKRIAYWKLFDDITRSWVGP